MGAPRDPSSLQSTTELLELARQGHAPAKEQLIRRHLPALKRWAHGRLPSDARALIDTDDLVQAALIRALGHLDAFEPRHEGSFIAYLRRILRNQIIDEVRKIRRRPRREGLDDGMKDGQPSPLDLVIGSEALERYERALACLSRDQQEAIVLRIEFGYSYDAMAGALGRPSANAARLFVSRALIQLAEKMREPE